MLVRYVVVPALVEVVVRVEVNVVEVAVLPPRAKEVVDVVMPVVVVEVPMEIVPVQRAVSVVSRYFL